jgi:hypothetical protein
VAQRRDHVAQGLLDEAAVRRVDLAVEGGDHEVVREVHHGAAAPFGQ